MKVRSVLMYLQYFMSQPRLLTNQFVACLTDNFKISVHRKIQAVKSLTSLPTETLSRKFANSEEIRTKF